MTKKQKTILIFAFVIGIILLISFSVIFSDKGFYTYLKLKKEKSELLYSFDSLKYVNDSLKIEIQKLQLSDEKIERVAREKYGMIKPGEKVYKIEK